jgi:hypothetical protein
VTTRRVQPSTKTYEQRKRERREADHARQREAQAEATRKRYERSVAPPDPPAPSFEERAVLRKAELQGAHDAAYAAEQRAAEAAASAGPVNHFRVRADELKDKLYQPDIKRKFKRFDELADKWDREQIEKAQDAERQQAIDNDPAVQRARSYAEGLVKLAPTDELRNSASEILGIAQAGDASLAWERIRAHEELVFRHLDTIAAEKLASKNVTDQEFKDAAAQAEAARDLAAKMAEETPDD